MKVNVYKEEQTMEVAVVKKKAGTGADYVGMSFILHSATELHDDSGDDDRSAVIFWGTSREELAKFLSRAVDELEKTTYRAA
jgi:hypothetical protein